MFSHRQAMTSHRGIFAAGRYRLAALQSVLSARMRAKRYNVFMANVEKDIHLLALPADYLKSSEYVIQI